MELATFENTVFAFEPIKRIVPTTRTRITASMTAYSAMSCPSSSDHILLISSRMGSLLRARFREQEGTDLNSAHMMHARAHACQMQIFASSIIPQCCEMAVGRGISAAPGDS